MVYINPIEILELKDKEVNTLDSNIIKKAKKRLFADIELSDDGHLDYKGSKLTKSDCERAIDELEDKNKVEFFNHLANNKQLNEFLANGNQDLLTSFKQESIYSLPEFIDFVSPYFSVKLDRVLLKSFQNCDLEIFRSALRTESLLKQSDLNNAYKSISTEIDGKISEVDKITKSIKEENTSYTSDDIQNVIGIAEKHFPIELLNCLPIYFQSQINKIASSINYLQLSIWNEFTNTAVPLSLLEYLLQLNIESVSKPTFEKNYSIIKRKHQDKIEQEKNAPLLKKWASILISIQSKVKTVEDESLKANSAYNFVKDAFTLNELNELPSFANEIRTQIGYSIRSISIACWNKQSDINSALALIDLALKIKLTEKVKLAFRQDKTELEELEKKYRGVLVCNFCDTDAPDEGSNYEITLYKITSRDYQGVKYQYLPINIPRCPACKSYHGIEFHHESVSGKSFGFGLVGLLAGVAVDVVAYTGGGAISGVSKVISKINDKSNTPRKDTRQSTISNFHKVKELLSDGWTFSKPTA